MIQILFFSISFLTVLIQINSPIHRQSDDALHIGFPFTYYSQFTVDGIIPNSGWLGKHLLLDIFLTWLVTIAIYFLATRRKSMIEK